MCRIFNRIVGFIKARHRKVYSLVDTFGCTEKVPQDCPTFVEREVHQLFMDDLYSYNIIVVYGESRQGKTWMVDKYCPHQIRVGCSADMTLKDIKVQMLTSSGIKIREVEHSITNDKTQEQNCSISVGSEGTLDAESEIKGSRGHSETIKTKYVNVDINNQNEFFTILSECSAGEYFVFDNFHYLAPGVQKDFCSLLKEFNYRNIKIIIVGVWKEASRITALAPDLVNRCAHIDVGSWKKDELRQVLQAGQDALNISIDSTAQELFISCCAENIGIFKDMVQKYCQKFGIKETCKNKMDLDNEQELHRAITEVMQEAYVPLHDRVINLAMPQREKKDSKHMRLKIIIAVLRIVISDDADCTKSGIPISDISEKVNSLCEELHESKIPISNLTQELGMLHRREENKKAGGNFIPLFFFDQPNKQLLILEPTLYAIRNYNPNKIEGISNELVEKLRSYSNVGSKESDCK